MPDKKQLSREKIGDDLDPCIAFYRIGKKGNKFVYSLPDLKDGCLSVRVKAATQPEFNYYSGEVMLRFEHPGSPSRSYG